MPHDVLVTFAQTALADGADQSSARRVCDAISVALLNAGAPDALLRVARISSSSSGNSSSSSTCSSEVMWRSYRFGSAEGDVGALAYVRMRTSALIVILDEEEARSHMQEALRFCGFFSSQDARVFSVEISRREPGYILGVYALLLVLTMMVLVFWRDSAAKPRVDSSSSTSIPSSSSSTSTPTPLAAR